MTLLDVRNRIINIFTSQDTFCPEDFAAIEIDEAFEANRDGLILRALEQLEEMGVLSQTDEDLWILNEPLDIGGQDLHISTRTANTLAMVINAYLDSKKATGGRADAMQIGEIDVVMALNIIGELLEKDALGENGPDTEDDDDEDDDIRMGESGPN